MSGTSGGAGGSVSSTISGGVFFHAVIQGRDITVQLPPEVTPALSGLPAPSPTFTGRDTDVDELFQGLAPDGGERQRAVLVAAVAGLAGVGKTELVVQTAARALKEPGWFPGGVLFTDLFGYDTERRLSPEHALDGLLRALGMPGEHIPAGLQDRTRLYRSVLAAFAEQNRRILVVIDNASSAEQARPLLPTDGTTAALLTSRHTLDVDARLHDLDILDEPASIELLRQALHQARGAGDSRVEDAPEAAAAVARLCAGLPLALRIAAALLADTPARPLTSLAHALEAEHSRLERLRREDRAVRAAFDLSYQHLDPNHARLFRLLPLNPGPDMSTEAAAHLAGTDPAEVEELLQDLVRAHLIEPGPTWGRWRLHDLVRLYADQHTRTHADTDERETASTRLFSHYETHAEAADTHLETRPGTPSPRFPDRAAALAWLDAEHDNLTATATTLGHPRTSIVLALALARYLDYRRAFDDWIAVTTTALAVFREHGVRYGEAGALNNLGSALREVRRFDEAIDAHTQALAVFRELGVRDGEALALDRLGIALAEVRRFDEAIDAHTRAATVYRDLGDRHGEGTALGNLGNVLAEVRRFDEAVDALTQAATILRDLGDRYGEGTGLGNLGLVLAEVRRFDEAIDAHTQALAVYRAHGDRHGEGQTLTNFGNALREVGRFDEAVDALTQAATILRDLGDRHGESGALTNLGNVLREARRFDEAIDALTQAATILRDLGDRHGEGVAVGNLGNALVGVRRFDEAIGAHTQALAVYRETGDRHSEAMALGNLGIALAEVDRLDEAIDTLTQAATTYHELGDRHSKGQALTNLGAVLAEVGRLDEAIGAHTQALAVFRELGDRHGEAMALGNLGIALAEVGRLDEAIDTHDQSLAVFRELGDRHDEAMALGNLGIALAEVGRLDEAIDTHTRAATVYRETGDRHSEGEALNNRGLALAGAGRLDEAIDTLTRAATIFRETGDHDSEGVVLNSRGLVLAEAGRPDDNRRLHL
ncbi:tetratricopeptide repeat protein [Streptomyces sp. NPDC127106]|uniref:tetratricopeptide repeat protein n=1 Tax=Streptomyces sp. NPDC127106 TaxID=3345360 RepID=UPI0036287554